MNPRSFPALRWLSTLAGEGPIHHLVDPHALLNHPSPAHQPTPTYISFDHPSLPSQEVHECLVLILVKVTWTGVLEHEHLSLNHDFDVFANLPVKLDDVGV